MMDIEGRELQKYIELLRVCMLVQEMASVTLHLHLEVNHSAPSLSTLNEIAKEMKSNPKKLECSAQ